MREFAVWQDVRYVCRVCHVCIGDVKMHGGNKSTTTKLTGICVLQSFQRCGQGCLFRDE